MQRQVLKEELRLDISPVNYTVAMLVLSLTGFFVVCNVYTMLPIIGELSTFFAVPEAAIGWATSSFTLFYSIGFLLFGPLSDRLGRWQVMVYGLAALSVVTGIIYFMEELKFFIILRALQGFLAATFAPAALTYVFEVFPLEKRGLTIVSISAGFSFSGILGQIFSSWITKMIEWNYVFLFFSLIYFIMFMIAWSILPKDIRIKASAERSSFGNQIMKVLGNVELIKGYVIAITLFFCFVGMYASFGGYLTREYGLDTMEILWVRFIGIIGVGFSFFTGPMVRKHGLKKVLNLGLVIAAIGLLMEGATSNLSFIIVSTVIFVSGFSMVIPVMIQVIGTIGQKERSIAVTIYTFILFLGASIGPIMLRISDFNLVCFILASVLVVSFFLSLVIKVPGE
ncbi:MFS transporter [Ammoniphilus sp. YIM 78166]|uniref:MFS transporter n=1 Tax=Ammoniphilus sp. YIM 78166 TaxID=1644106 RepID=UPI00106F70C2|nr:MFS transporter [Ammoniphilus sp. YIM 78166]